MKTLDTKTHTTRRQFLRMSAGAAMLVTPILRTSRAYAQAPRRLVFFQVPLGTVAANYFPGGAPTVEHAASGIQPLGALSRILAPLDPWKSKLLLVSGMRRNPDPPLNGNTSQDEGHKEVGSMLTGRMCTDIESKSRHGNISVDQFIKTRLPASMPEKTLQLGCWRTGTGEATTLMSADRTLLSSAGPATPLIPEFNPQTVFDRVFAGLTTTPGAAPDPVAERLRAERKSVLDAVTKEIASMQGKLSGGERSKLDHHMTSIRELELGLQPTPIPAGAGCAKPVRATDHYRYAKATSQEWVRTQMDIATMAMACDLARVAVISGGPGRGTPAFAGVTPGSNGDWHDDFTHNTDGWEQHSTIHTWYVTQFEYMVKRFADLGMLDSSALIHFSEEGARFGGAGNQYPFRQYHNQNYWYPYVVAGSCGGYFKQGVQVNIRKSSLGTKNFLFNCLRAMGIEDTMMGNVTASPIPEMAATA